MSALDPKDLDDVLRLATLLTESSVVSQTMTAADVALVILSGHDLGLSAAQAVCGLTVVDGRLVEQARGVGQALTTTPTAATATVTATPEVASQPTATPEQAPATTATTRPKSASQATRQAERDAQARPHNWTGSEQDGPPPLAALSEGLQVQRIPRAAFDAWIDRKCQKRPSGIS